MFGFAIHFAHTGVKVTYDSDATNNVYAAVVRGWDQFNDANDDATWITGFLLSSKSMCGTNRRLIRFELHCGSEQVR